MQPSKGRINKSQKKKPQRSSVGASKNVIPMRGNHMPNTSSARADIQDEVFYTPELAMELKSNSGTAALEDAVLCLLTRTESVIRLMQIAFECDEAPPQTMQAALWVLEGQIGQMSMLLTGVFKNGETV